MCCLWTNKQFATNLNCKPNHQWIFLLFSLYFLIKFLWNCLCSMYAQIFRNAIFFYIWWNSLTIFGRCTYFSLKQLNSNFILHISKHRLRTCDKSFFFKISQMVFSNWADGGINCGLFRVHSQFYIQLVFKAPLCVTLTISDQKKS